MTINKKSFPPDRIKTFLPRVYSLAMFYTCPGRWESMHRAALLMT